jgi:hypothetical protein
MAHHSLGGGPNSSEQPTYWHILTLDGRHTCVRAGEEQKIVHKATHSRGLGQDLAERLLMFMVIGRGQLDLGIAADQRQWRAQLVRGIGNEIGLRLQGCGKALGCVVFLGVGDAQALEYPTGGDDNRHADESRRGKKRYQHDPFALRRILHPRKRLTR